MIKNSLLILLLGVVVFLAACQKEKSSPGPTPTSPSVVYRNPIIKDKFTADPAALVHNGTVYLYAGHDEAPVSQEQYIMNEWLCYSSTDMVTWTEHPVPLRVTDFTWARADAWASQVVERNGKFYWYATVDHATIPGKSIGVAVSDSPTGPFKDARGSALITNDMTQAVNSFFDDIDPTVFIDDSRQAYLYWGNTACYYARLKENMTELDGPIQTISLPAFTEAPWVHKRGEWYYLSYATGFPERIAYAMSRSPEGPWEYQGILNELPVNSNTNHQAIIEFKGKWYSIYHNGAISPNGGSFRRSVSVDYLNYNTDHTLQKVVMTSKGVEPAL
ncbi:glycoside hydrolase (plasmid) [Hymenobacter sp. DG25B]|uniref:glycoside hydrolase family 43 protein n=1 Tax=Hymenobacter sp. DG25B TaxID=1385664 RepID=UPI000540D98B|nr:glycoside hydrolase family 43 protein [Hymenobacter sp. DG25B]AIZ65337.1 glycoside hydrolase [Hymenobacter sp. DG25B]